MNKRITSLLLCFVMVFAMLATAVPAFAVTGKSTYFKMTADKTEASPGDTVTYTAYIGPVDGLAAIKFKLKFPSGLTYVEGSGKAVDGLQSLLNSAKAEFTESTKVFIVGSSNYTRTEDTALMKFQCKVNDDATGSQTVEFYIDDPDNLFDQDSDNIDFTLHNATVNVVAAPKPATNIKLNKSETTIYTGNTETLVATVEPSDTTDTVVWTSSKESVATVDNTGKVTAVAPGTATITAKAGDKTATCTVTVENAPCTHTDKTNVDAKPSTCTEQGWEAYSKCNDCGQLFDKDGNEISAIPYLSLAAHSLTPVAAKAATCTENGNKAYYKCDVCGKWFEDATANVEITDHSSVVLTALGHDWKDATCTEPKTCKRDGCGATEGAANGHNAGTEWKTNETHHWHICLTCGEKLVETEGRHNPDREAPTVNDPVKCSVCDYEITPALETVKVEIPFTVTVKQGGNVAPGKQTFELEIFEILNRNANEYSDVTVTASVETNGKGDYTAKLVIKGSEEQVNAMICEGFYVREKNTGIANWEYSDAVWYVNPNINGGYDICPAVLKTSDNGDYYEPDMENAAEKMTFVNTYTENKTVTPEDTKPEDTKPEDTKPEDTKSPQTGDNSNMIPWIALLFVSGGVLAGTTLYSRKRKSVK